MFWSSQGEVELFCAGGSSVLPQALTPGLWVWLPRKCCRLCELLVCSARVDHPAMSNVCLWISLEGDEPSHCTLPSCGHHCRPCEPAWCLPPPRAWTSSSSSSFFCFQNSCWFRFWTSKPILLVSTGSHLLCGPCLWRIQTGRQRNCLLPKGALDLVCYNLRVHPKVNLLDKHFLMSV